MKYYQSISLLPNSDVSPNFVWKKLYQQIHIILADNKTEENKSKIGVSFPEYDETKHALGMKLRLFAYNEETLKRVQLEKWLERLKDYVHISKIKPVPEKISEYACFKHVKLKGNREKLARRRATRKGLTFEQALEHYEGFDEQHTTLPYINMVSATNGQRFRLFIEKRNVDDPQKGMFSCYGLSSKTAVPLF